MAYITEKESVQSEDESPHKDKRNPWTPITMGDVRTFESAPPSAYGGEDVNLFCLALHSYRPTHRICFGCEI